MAEHSHNCHVSTADSEAIIARIIAQLRGTGMRKTEALEDLLHTMVKHHRPFLLTELSDMPGLAERDQATIYRLVIKLKDHGIVRQLSLGEKGNYFQLNLADHHHDYLLCRECGVVTEVPVECVLKPVEEKLVAQHGWQNLTHSLAFQGICPDCLPE